MHKRYRRAWSVASFGSNWLSVWPKSPFAGIVDVMAAYQVLAPDVRQDLETEQGAQVRLDIALADPSVASPSCSRASARL